MVKTATPARVSNTGPLAKKASASKGTSKTTSKPAATATARVVPELAVSGSISFVGMGPGDPTLLTLRAADRLAAADVVILDQMSRAERNRVLARCPSDVAVYDLTADAQGILPAGPARCKLLVDHAKAGKAVVRVLPGDLTLSAALTEEAAGCAKAHVPFEVVPGVSTLSAWPGYAGIPLTTATAPDMRVITAQPEVDWAAAGAGDASLVLIGAVPCLDTIAKQLVAAGRKDTTPVAVITDGTTSEQHTIISSLGKLSSTLSEIPAALRTPAALTVVGDVVALREKFSWFESRPLFSWRVLVPRTKDNADAMLHALVTFGAVPEEVPTIAVEPPRTPQQIERAITGLVTGRFDWIGFTSANAVRAVREKLEEYGLDARAFSGMKVAAMGEQTVTDLLAWGIKPDLVPEGGQTTADLLEVWPDYDPGVHPINRVFLPRADISTESLANGLTDRGWEVEDVIAYRTVRAAPPPAEVREAIKGGAFDAVLFTSSSTVRNLVGIAGKPHTTTIIGCIGPETAATAAEHGLRVDVLAETPSVQVLVQGLAEFAARARLAAIEAGQVVTPGSLRPSQRRASSRRRAAALAG